MIKGKETIVKRIIILLVLAAIVLFFSGCRSKEPDEQKSVLLIYGDEENAKGFAELLGNSGLNCESLSQEQFNEETPGLKDLVVALSCCKEARRGGWDSTFFDKVGNARVLAVGDSGASLLELKKLLIGNPHGWHGSRSPKIVVFPESVVNSPLGGILQQPNDLLGAEQKEISIEIHSGTGELEHTGIYDGGHFPEGTDGIGRESTDLHHWIISKQGNFVLWGANSTSGNLTDTGKKLFVNLCWFLAKLEPQQLIFPEKNYLAIGAYNCTLKGGWRDKYYFVAEKRGPLSIRLEWGGDNTMVLMTKRPLVARKDGKSPLTITHDITEDRIGQEFGIEVGSFSLSEGSTCEYQIIIADREL